MAIEYALLGNAFVLYDGTNSAEVLAAVAAQWTGAFIVSEEGGILTISSGQPVNDPVRVAAGERLGVNAWSAVSAADWLNKYVKA